VALVALLASTGEARGQAATTSSRIPVQAGSVVDRDTVTVGQVFHLTVRVRAPRGAAVNFPTAIDSLGAVQALEPPVVRDGADSSAADRIATYRVAAWDVERQEIRIGDVIVQTDVGERRVSLNLPTIFVRRVLPADSALRVPKPARALVTGRAPLDWRWLAAATLAALLIGLGIWLWRRRGRPSVGSTGDPLADADAAFDRVERLRLIDAGEPGRHAALMADVVRRYLASRHEAASLAHTSGELLAATRGLPTVPFDRLSQLLEDVDPVKFAAAPLAAERARSIGDEARALVREEHARATAPAEGVEAAA
jgi:hypothetical protein